MQTLLLLTLTAPNLFGQMPGVRGFGGYGGDYFPYPNLFMPFPGGYGYGGYNPNVNPVPSTAYFT